MVRWEPGARERLQTVALALYAKRGFEETTVAEIAAAAGLTARTFYRHFADKREVIFGGEDEFQGLFVRGIGSGPAGGNPLELVASAVTGVEYFPDEMRAHSRQRQAVIAANPELQERELLKLAALGTAIAVALRERGIPEPTATLSAQSGVTVFQVAFQQWIAEGETRSLVELEREMFTQLAGLTAAEPRKTKREKIEP
jgi:AcrR family transcriptional regulator